MALRVHVGGGRISLNQLEQLAEALRELAGQVADEYPQAGRGSFDFVVAEAHTGGSLDVVVGARPKRAGIEAPVGEHLLAAVTEGLQKVNSQAVRPPYFSDRALEAAKRLHSIRSGEITGVRVSDGHAKPVDLGPSLSENVDRILRAERIESIGSVEGRIEEINIHNTWTFAVWDAVSGRRYDCKVGRDFNLNELMNAFGRRVLVRGLLSEPRTRRGRPRVEVRSLRILRDPDELPGADDVRGILGS